MASVARLSPHVCGGARDGHIAPWLRGAPECVAALSGRSVRLDRETTSMFKDSGRDGAPSARGRWVTRLQIGLLAVTAVLCGFVGMAFGPLSRTTAQAPSGFRGQGGPGGPGGFGGRGGFGGMQQERKILAQFDKDKNKRLDLAERSAARAWLATQGNSGPGGRRGGGGRGGFATPAPGPKLTPAGVK